MFNCEEQDHFQGIRQCKMCDPWDGSNSNHDLNNLGRDRKENKLH